MKLPSPFAFKILFATTVLYTVSACTHSSEIAFPADETEFPQPVSRSLKFSEPWKINWTDSVLGVTPLIKKLDFNKLPVRIFDSSGFLPFAKKPEEVNFNWDKLPDTIFNYDNLPSKPLVFETSVLEPPKLIKAGNPYLKRGTSNLVYELGELQGLMGTKITCLLKDKTGMLWIATDQGLYRYDGQNLFLYFRVLPSYSIFSMLEDRNGNIWVGTTGNRGDPTGGLFIIDLRAGIIKHLLTERGLGTNWIISMLSDNMDRVWMTTYPNGIKIVDENTNTIKTLNKEQGLSNESAGMIIQDAGNNIWISTTGGGINIVDLKKGKMKYLNKENGLNNDSVSSMLKDNSNRIWIKAEADSAEVNEVDVKQGIIKHFNRDQGLNASYIFRLMNDQKGNIWLATIGNGVNTFGNGVQILDPATDRIKQLNTSNGLTGNDVRYLLQDDFQQIWIATRAGLNMLNRNGNNIEHKGKKEIATLAEDAHGQIWIGNLNSGIDILDKATGLARSLTKANGLCNDTVQNMMVENGNIWIGTNGGTDIIDSAFKTIHHFGRVQGLNTENEATMMKDKEGNMWLGSSNFDAAGIDVLDMQKRTIHHLGIAQGLKDTIISDIKQDKLGQVWVTTFTGGIYIIDPVKNTMKHLDDLPGLKDRYNKLFLPDEHDNMWIGTGKGIYIINAKGDSVIAFSTHEGLISNNIISLNEYNGSIYAGTTAGISVIAPPSASNEKNWKVESFGKAQGISKIGNSYASDIITKKGMFLWGDMGINFLDNTHDNIAVPKTYVTGIEIFDQPQYFTDEPWLHISKKDTLWNIKKDTFYLEGRLPANTLFPQQDKMQWDSVSDAFNMPVNLLLPYYQNYIQFRFTQANLGSQDTTWYKYILEGIDKKWSEKTSNFYSQNYLNLPPGAYQFKVSSMYKGKWSEPAIFKFTINAPWWQTLWAYVLYIVIFGGLVLVFSLYRSRKLKRENIRLEEKITKRTNQLQQSLEELKATQSQLIQSEKMASLGELTAGIAHEIQNPLNFVNNFSDVNKELLAEMREEITKGNYDEVNALAKDVEENEEKINHHGKRAEAIVKGMLQHSRSSSSAKEPTNINVLADEYLRLSYHGLRAKNKSFNSEMQTDFDESIGKINIIPQDIGRVLLNLYNNAFYAVNEKMKQATKDLTGLKDYEPIVSVSTKKNNGKVEINVKDNANGIPQKVVDKIFQPFFTTKPTGQGTGLGLSLSYDIIKAHGGEIKVETKEGEGSEFTIQLPES